MVSNVIGQGRKDEVMHMITRIMKLSSGFALLACLVINIFPEVFLSIYGQKTEFLNIGIPVIRVVSIAMVFMSLGIIWLNAVTGTGNSRMTFLIELVAIIFYCIYVYFVLEYYSLSILWGWLSELLYWSLIFGLSFRYIRNNRWRSTVI
jgi:Na+-driven multidrug efflux pump